MSGKPPLQGRRKIVAFRRERNQVFKAGLIDYLAGPVDAARVIAKLGLAEPTGPAVLPRHIWMYWHDGWDNAPEIANLCLQSWRMRNPGYEVHALDYRSLGDFLPNPPVHYEKAKLSGFSDRVRLRLLRAHGGAWADATSFCIQPIDSWIGGMVSPARFFAFTLPAADRPITSWFLAGTLQSPIVAAWEELVARYFMQIEREARPVHAYFFMHYIFEYALQQSALLQAQWDRMPKEPVLDAGRVSTLAKLQTAEEPRTFKPERWDKIAKALRETRMQKLTWKGAIREGGPRTLRMLDLLRANLQEAP